MEHWWDVKIEFQESKLKNERIGSVLLRYKSLDQHFEVLNS